MSEQEFWVSLEYRVCRELAGVADDSVRFWGCDGFIPEAVQPQSNEIHGDAWMCDGPRQELWRFVLRVPPAFDSGGGNWAALLPPEDVTGWLSLDRVNRIVRIDPSRARADGQPAGG